MAEDCILSVYCSSGEVSELGVQLPSRPAVSRLDELYEVHLAGRDCRWARVRCGVETVAVFLAESEVPRHAIRFAGTMIGGRWATSRLDLGDGLEGRGVLGPDMFFRQMELAADEAWLVPALLGLPTCMETQDIVINGQCIHSWTLRDLRYYYAPDGRGAWRLLGGGSTPWDRIEAIVIRRPASVGDFLRIVGALHV